ncbi:anti-sigma factor family protein [Pseudonocardia saturnea]
MTGETHRTIREELGAYALGQLTGDRWHAVHDHLETCAVCRADLDEIAPVAGLLGGARDRLRPDDLSTDPAPPPLPDALIAEVRAAAPPDRTARRRPRRVRLAAAAAAGVLVAGGVGYVVGAAAGPQSQEQVPREDVAVRAAAPGIRAEAALIAHTWGMEVTLTATGFTAGEAYIVTVTDDAGRTVGAGEFLGTGGQEMVCNLNSSVLRADASLVQVTAPDGQVVLDAAV